MKHIKLFERYLAESEELDNLLINEDDTLGDQSSSLQKIVKALKAQQFNADKTNAYRSVNYDDKVLNQFDGPVSYSKDYDHPYRGKATVRVFVYNQQNNQQIVIEDMKDEGAKYFKFPSELQSALDYLKSKPYWDSSRLYEEEASDMTAGGAATTEQNELFKFLKGLSSLTGYESMGNGWMPAPGDGTKLQKNMLGSNWDKYTRDITVKKVEENQPLHWIVYIKNPPQAKQEATCSITGNPGQLYIKINPGLLGGSESASGSLNTPGTVEKCLAVLKTIWDKYSSRG